MTNEFVEHIRAFYATYRQELYSYALSLTRSAEGAEDAVHNAFSRVLRNGRRPRDLRAYLFRCVRNAALDERRSAVRRARDASLFEPLETAGDSDDGRLEVEEMLHALSDDERECIVLKLFSGLTFREIAKTRGVSLNTAASWYRRGIMRLKARMENER
jgi:RNA polymerase sigma-70 factor (ECF subfamily)